MLLLKYITKKRLHSFTGRELIYFGLLLIALNSCKKFVEVPPPTDAISEDGVFNSDATSISVLNGIYGSMNTTPFQGSQASGSIALFAGLAADEFTLDPTASIEPFISYYHNALTQTSESLTGGEHWPLLYNLIFKCNAAIEGLSSDRASTLTPQVKDQLLAEARFLRAFFYFILVNEYDGVPLALTTRPQITSLLPRSSPQDVYSQIIADLIAADEKLSGEYLSGNLLLTTTERIRPTNWAAKAVLSRVYLYTSDWQKAEEYATELINNTSKFNLESINNVFLKNSQEAIWQVQPTDLDLNTQDGRTFIITDAGPGLDQPVYLSSELLGSFEMGDFRAEYGNWIDTINVNGVRYTYPFKYKVNSSPGLSNVSDMSEYFMVLRLGEQYLIRAEARAEQDKISEAQADLNAIRTRAGLPSISLDDKPSLLTAILKERQVELFSEWGHRWFDLKRTGNLDAVMSISTPLKAGGTAWNSHQQLLPIPLSDIQKNPNLTQNPGY